MWDIKPYFSPLAIWASTFMTYCDLDLKSKIVQLIGWTIEIYSDLNPISQRAHLTLFICKSTFQE